MHLTNEWMNDTSLQEPGSCWKWDTLASCLSPSGFPVACLGLSWKIIFHTCRPHYNIIPQSEALWPLWRPVFNVMKGDLMELRRTKQKADSRFRKAEQTVPPRGKKKEKGEKYNTFPQKILEQEDILVCSIRRQKWDQGSPGPCPPQQHITNLPFIYLGADYVLGWGRKGDFIDIWSPFTHFCDSQTSGTELQDIKGFGKVI